MAILQWVKPTSAQLIEAQNTATALGRELTWVGDILSLDTTDYTPVEEEPQPEPDQ